MKLCIECKTSSARHFQNMFCYDCMETILNDHIERKFKTNLKEYRDYRDAHVSEK